MSFDGWLDARDSGAVELAWARLGAREVVVGEWGPPVRLVRPEGAALLAAHVLGCSPEQFAWFATERSLEASRWPPPSFEVTRTVSSSFVDRAHVVNEPECVETWQVREAVVGTRGVQHISIDCTWGEQTREGGEGRSSTIVRVFDRATHCAASIKLPSTSAWVVGEVDLSPLDLFSQRTALRLAWQTYDIEALRGVLAQLTADLDAHFDTSPTWPGGVVEDRVIDNTEYGFRMRKRVSEFASGEYAVSFDETLDPDDQRDQGWLTYAIRGLPWGHHVGGRIDRADDPAYGVAGWIDLTLPRAQLDATLARLARVPGIALD